MVLHFYIAVSNLFPFVATDYFQTWLLAINLTTSFIYQEPAQLNYLQDKGLTDIMLESLFNDKVGIIDFIK